jgi:hypothetical protein
MNSEYPDENIKFPLMTVNFANLATRPLYYPGNKFAQDMATLLKCKSFTKGEIDLMRKMGITINVEARPIEIPVEFQ